MEQAAIIAVRFYFELSPTSCRRFTPSHPLCLFTTVLYTYLTPFLSLPMCLFLLVNMCTSFPLPPPSLLSPFPVCFHRNLVKNLVVGYVQAPDRKKPEVLNLIAKILDFSPSEVQQVHIVACVITCCLSLLLRHKTCCLSLLLRHKTCCLSLLLRHKTCCLSVLVKRKTVSICSYYITRQLPTKTHTTVLLSLLWRIFHTLTTYGRSFAVHMVSGAAESEKWGLAGRTLGQTSSFVTLDPQSKTSCSGQSDSIYNIGEKNMRES